MKNALWFSRHAPTEAQLQDIECMGYALVQSEAGIQFGSVSITTVHDQEELYEDLIDLCREHQLDAIFGVFPTPILEKVCWYPDPSNQTSGNEWSITFYASWNVNRAPEGEKPAFTHKKFCAVGYIILPESWKEG